MSKNVSEFLIERLSEWGVRRIFGYPGDGINGILGALDKAKDSMKFIQSRHEELSALMACAHAKFTGEVGVCLATSGPGAIHLLNGLYDAKMDHQPVVAIVGQQSRSVLGGSYQQEVDLLSLFKDVASEYVQMATSPDQVRHLIDRAMRIAKDQRTVTCLIFPNDLQVEDVVAKPPHKHENMHSGIGFFDSRIVPEERELKKAAAIINAGKKVGILVGAGACMQARK
jgi:pyruvate dehydrogenase (quinone)